MEIPAVVLKDFVVKYGDDEFNVTFRQATMGDDMVRSSLFSERKTMRDAEGRSVEFYNLDVMKLMATEVRLTIAKCDLTRGKKKMFRPKMDEATFMAEWSALPAEIANLLHEKCIETNPDWGFRVAPESEEEE